MRKNYKRIISLALAHPPHVCTCAAHHDVPAFHFYVMMSGHSAQGEWVVPCYGVLDVVFEMISK